MRTAVTSLSLALVAALAHIATSTDTLPPCPTEDSIACTWDVDEQGNGQGRSFTTDAHGNTTYQD